MNPADLQHISNLESRLDYLGVWLLVATALVVLGLVLEYVHQIPESIKEFKESRSWWPILVVAGGILITVGVAGELLVQGVASSKETKLRKANHELFSNLNTEAATARKEASAAIEPASKADERASVNEKEAARLGNLAEAERLERMKLEAAIVPRSLTLEQQKLIAAAVQTFRGHAVLVSSYALDGEGAALAGQIIAALQSGGVKVADNRSSILVTGGFEGGIHVRGPDTEQDFVSSLGNALSLVGKLQVDLNAPQVERGAVMGGGGQSFPAGTVFVAIMVGVKPVPILPAAK